MDYFVLFCLILSFCAGFGSAIVWMWQVKRTALSIARTQYNLKGRQAQVEQEGELLALISDATAQFKAAKEAGEDMKAAAARILPQLVAKYPGVAMKQGKKLMKIFNDYGGLEGLEDFF